MATPSSRYLRGVNVAPYLSKHPTGLYDQVEKGSDVYEALYLNAALLDVTAPLHEQFGHFLYVVYSRKPIHPDAATRIPGSDGKRLARKMDRLAVSAAEHQHAAADDLRGIWSLIVQGWGEVGQKPNARRNDIDMTQ